jgi:aminopeptidase N
VRPLRYAATLTVDPKAERFSGEITIDLHLAAGTRTLWLHARHLDFDRAEISAGGQTLKATAKLSGEDFAEIDLPSPAGPGDARLALAYRGPIATTDLAGIFRSKENDDWYVFTQFERTSARNAFPCFDEPGFKVPWQLTLKVPRGLIAASNTPVESEADEGPLHVFRFAPTLPLPSYLIAFAVGPFERVDLGRWGANHTPMAAYIPKGRGGELGMTKEIVGPALERLEAYFGVPTPSASSTSSPSPPSSAGWRTRA